MNACSPARWWVPTSRTYLSIAHVCACNPFALAYLQPPLYLLDLCLNMMLSLVYLIWMCIVCVFTQQLDRVQPQRLTPSRIFSKRWIQGSRVSGLLYRYFSPLYLLDYCSMPFSLVQYLYVWSVVKRTHGVLPCTLVSTHLAHAYKYRFSTHMQLFCTCVPADASLFACHVFKYDISHMTVHSVCFHAAIRWSAAPSPYTF
jgi:hypothetical protein